MTDVIIFVISNFASVIKKTVKKMKYQVLPYYVTLDTLFILKILFHDKSPKEAPISPFRYHWADFQKCNGGQSLVNS